MTAAVLIVAYVATVWLSVRILLSDWRASDLDDGSFPLGVAIIIGATGPVGLGMACLARLGTALRGRGRVAGRLWGIR